MLSNARCGLAPPRLNFNAAFAPCCRRPSSTLTARRAEERSKKTKSPTTTACKAVPDRLGAPDLELPRRSGGSAAPLLLGDDLPTQEAAYDALAELAVDLLRYSNGKERVVVGLAGGPGSGKSTAAAAVVERINKIWRRRRQRRSSASENPDEDDETDIAVVLPMDGFHLTREQLSASTDPSPGEMFARRGAHWTFDGDAFVKTVEEIVSSAAAAAKMDKSKSMTVLAPSFDHGVGDPCPGAIEIRPSHRFVLVEGNYLLLPLEPWSRLVDGGKTSSSSSSPSQPPLFDQTWFLDVGVAEAMERVRRRQLAVGVSEATSRRRIEENDGPNGELVASTKGRADVVVRGDLPRASEQ